MEIEDARRVISTLSSLKIWFEGVDGKNGALDKIESLQGSLDLIFDKIDDVPELYLKDFKTLLNDTTGSALVVQSDVFVSEIDKIMGDYFEKLPSQVARIVLKAIQSSNVDKAEYKKLLVRLNKSKSEFESIEKSKLIIEKELGEKKKINFLLMAFLSVLLSSNFFLSLIIFL